MTRLERALATDLALSERQVRHHYGLKIPDCLERGLSVLALELAPTTSSTQKRPVRIVTLEPRGCLKLSSTRIYNRPSINRVIHEYMKASSDSTKRSKLRANRRLLNNHAIVRSTTQRFGAILKSSLPGLEIPLVNSSVHFTVPFNHDVNSQPLNPFLTIRRT